MNEAPEGWVVYQQRNKDKPGVVIETVWASADGKVEVLPLENRCFSVHVHDSNGGWPAYVGPSREACVAWWTVEQSNEPTNYIKGQSGSYTCWDEVGSITLEALNGLLED